MKNQIIAEYRKAAQKGCEKYWNAKKKFDELQARSGLQRDFYYTDIIANSERFDSVAAESISDSYTEA